MGGKLVGDGFGHAEIDDLGHRLATHVGHQNVGWLEIAVNDRLLVGMLHAFANLAKYGQPVPKVHLVPVAIDCDRQAGHILHYEVRTAELRHARVKDARDGRMVHQREGLLLRFEAAHDLPCIHTFFDQLERDAAPYRVLLLGQPDFAHPASADQFQQMIWADNLRHLCPTGG